MLSGSGLVCAFGTAVSEAVWVSASHIECNSAAAPGGAATTVAVTVSNNNADFSAAATFTYLGMLPLCFLHLVFINKLY